MESNKFDVVVVGAGIAGTTVAAALSPHCRVALLEAEEAAGYHTTGRSAAMWILTYGPPDVQHLTGLSRSFLMSPPAGFSVNSLGAQSCPDVTQTPPQLHLTVTLPGGTVKALDIRVRTP